MNVDLDRARRDAKALLAAALRGEVTLRGDRPPRLADAQREVARSLGEPSWPALVARVEAERILSAALAGRRAEALALAARRPRAASAARALGQAALPEVAEGGAVQALLELGVDPNVRDAAGSTPLHRAARAGRLDIVDVLVGWVRTERTARDAKGRTPLDVATDSAVRAVLGSVTATRELRTEHGELAWRSDAGQLKSLAGSPLVATRRLGRGVAVRTGLADNTRNGVVCDDASPDEIAATLGWLGGVPAVWLVGPDARCGQALERAGCRPEQTGVHMVARLEALDAAPGRARAVGDSAGLDAVYGRIEDDPEHRAAELALLASLGFDGSHRHFSLADGAAYASTFTAGGVCTLTDLWVAPAQRRRGLGRALALDAMAATGAPLVLLAPTPATVPFFAALGFGLERFPLDRLYYSG